MRRKSLSLFLVLVLVCLAQVSVGIVSAHAEAAGTPPDQTQVDDQIQDDMPQPLAHSGAAPGEPREDAAVSRSRPRAVRYLPLAGTEWITTTVQAGEELGCLAHQGGVPWEAIAQANQLLNPTTLLFNTANEAAADFYVPLAAMAGRVTAARRYDTPLSLAARHNLSAWDIARHNPLPLYEGTSLRLPGASDDDTTARCRPYPLVDVKLPDAPVVRGQTTVIEIETAEPATCEVTYLGQTEPCYTEDQQYFYAFLGLSALMSPGSYDVTLHLHADGLDVDTSFPLEVEAGRYGFQFIDPPPRLNRLLDASLMSRESEYLAFWRLVRWHERRWQFPLDFPLPRPASVSAGYGDRRSYGGMVDGYHSGVDYRVWSGVPVLAPADGVVMLTDTLEMRGNMVLINHGWGLVTGYWHLSKIDVNIGDEVKRGEPFAYVGNTGLSTGSHLHWEMWVNGVSVDAEQWLEPDGLAAELPPFEAPVVYTTSEPEPPSESQTR